MPTIEVSEEQHTFIQRLRQELEREVVGRYGHVRELDAIQFLIDNLDQEATIETDLSVPRSDGSGTTISYEDGERDADEGGDPDGATAAAAEESTDDGKGSDENEAGDSDESDAAGSDEDRLEEMMNLLETHDDKWEKSSSEEYRYSVTLPDGATEDVRTKDDVRALLFKHYR